MFKIEEVNREQRMLTVRDTTDNVVEAVGFRSFLDLIDSGMISFDNAEVFESNARILHVRILIHDEYACKDTTFNLIHHRITDKINVVEAVEYFEPQIFESPVVAIEEEVTERTTEEIAEDAAVESASKAVVNTEESASEAVSVEEESNADAELRVESEPESKPDVKTESEPSEESTPINTSTESTEDKKSKEEVKMKRRKTSESRRVSGEVSKSKKSSGVFNKETISEKSENPCFDVNSKQYFTIGDIAIVTSAEVIGDVDKSNISYRLYAVNDSYTYFVGDNFEICIDSSFENNFSVKDEILKRLSAMNFIGEDNEPINLYKVCIGEMKNISIYPAFSAELTPPTNRIRLSVALKTE